MLEVMDDKPLLNIGAFAIATGLSTVALRHYSEIELFRPVRVDPDTGYRQYAADQIEDARLICGLREVNLPLDEIRTLLAGHRARVRAALDNHRERLLVQSREIAQ